jgi:hypothetical protein
MSNQSPITTGCRRRTSRDNEAAIRALRECGDGTLDLVGIPHVNRTQLDAERGCHGLDSAELTGTSRNGGITKDCCACHARCDLFEQFQQLAGHRVFKGGKAGGVATRPRQAFHIAGADRIADNRENDRNRLGRVAVAPPRRSNPLE